MYDDEDEDKDKYLSLSDNIDEFRYSDGAVDKSLAGLKIVGKSLFNVGKFAFSEVLPKAMDHMEKESEKYKK